MNPLYQELNGNNNNILQRFNDFKKTISGDPKEQIQQMLNSGRITQQQFLCAIVPDSGPSAHQ